MGWPQRDGLTWAGVEDDETKRHKGTVGEVEAAQGKHPLPPATLIEHDEELINKPNGPGVACLYLLTVEPPPKDMVPGEYNPPPPPDPPPKPMPNDSQTTQHRVSTPPPSAA